MRIGAHFSIVPRFSCAVEEAVSLGCNTLQIFPGNPRSWTKRPLDAAEAREFRRAARRAGVEPAYVHASYLINLASESAEVRRRSRSAFFDELERTRALGCRGYVIHIHGTETGGGMEFFASALSEGLRRSADVRVILENTAHTRSLEGMGRLMRRTRSRRVRLCLDTAHAYAAGFDISGKSGLRELLRQVDRTVGLERVDLVHANDTRVECGSGTDRHENIGEGRIGVRGFSLLCRSRALRALPFILETPARHPGDDRRNIQALRRAARIRSNH